MMSHMLKRRVVKQAAYAGGLLVFLLVAVVLAGLFVTRPPRAALPSPTPPSPYKPLIIEQVDVVAHGTTADIVARLRNPNPRAGVAEYPITFVLLNSSQESFHERQEITYVLPGSVQYVVALDVPLAQPLQQVEVKVPDVSEFQELPKTIDVPTFASFHRQSTVRDVGGRVVEEQKWVVRNTSTFSFQRVEVVAVAHADDGRVVGIGTTLAGALAVGEQREVTLQWPAPSSPSSRVTVFPSTNVFLDANIIRAQGDPGAL